MPSTQSVCGDFVEATRPDYGQCKPRRLKRDCRNHVPTVPGWGEEPPTTDECSDPNVTTEYDAAQTPPLRTIASIMDEDCEVVEDPDGNPITGPII